ncbi:MAG: HEAT repeat domain-containing protein [Candidatus Wallbacteria bacterium]|nr:HEAT repeat domain-containing protein [Candidatus Wallbacteria bacterium]
MNDDFNRLVQVARAGDAARRLDAVRQLSVLEAPDALSVLQALAAADPDRTIRIEACRAARELRTRLTGGTMDAASKTGVGPSALAERLRSPEPTERAKALYGCLRYESERVLTAILDLLEREASAKVRALAVAAVGVLGSSSEMEPMRRFLQDPDVGVRAAADEALAKLAELRPGPALAAGTRARPEAASVPRPAAPAASAESTEAAPAGAAASAAKPAAARPPGATATGTFRAVAPPARPGTTTGVMARPSALSPFVSRSGVAMKATLKPGALKPLGVQMSDDEKARLERLLASLSGGVLAEVEKSRLADRGTKLYQEIGTRLALPALTPPVARALFLLAAGNAAGAAEAFRAAPKDTVHQPHLDVFLKAAFSDAELVALRTAKEEAIEELKGRDAFPPEILEMVLGTIRKAKGLMNELDVSLRTKLRIKYDTLRDLLAEGKVKDAEESALFLKREMTRLNNILVDERNKALKAKMR